MYQPKRLKPTQKPKRPKALPIVLFLALVLILEVSVSGIMAFLADNTEPVVNTFTPGQVDCEVVETVNNNVKSSVTVKNTGNIPACIRVAVVGNTVDGDGNITGSFDVSGYLAGSGWSQKGDYYYYDSAIEAGKATGELLKSSIDLPGKQVTILAEAIQADGDAKTSAWG